MKQYHQNDMLGAPDRDLSRSVGMSKSRFRWGCSRRKGNQQRECRGQNPANGCEMVSLRENLFLLGLDDQKLKILLSVVISAPYSFAIS